MCPEQLRQCLHDALASLAVAVGVVCKAHAFVSRGVCQQFVKVLGDGGHFCTNQFDGAGLYGFGAFGGVAHDQHGLAKRRRLFLDAAGIGQDDV